MPTAPRPFHILRSHSAALSALAFSADNTILYAGDQEGHVSITDLRTRRVITDWKAHEGGILGLEEWNGRLVRDNTILIHEPTPAPGSSRSPPPVASTLTTNSLNFCRFSLCHAPGTSKQAQRELDDLESAPPSTKGKEKARDEPISTLLAVPSLIDSELIDIYALPSLRRLHASINYLPKAKKAYGDSVVPPEGRSGLIMSLHLGWSPLGALTCVAGFEDGRVEVWQCEKEWDVHWDSRMSDGPPLWTKKWDAKGHNEAIMAMAVANDLSSAFSVSADHLIVRYDLTPVLSASAVATLGGASSIKSFSTGQIGNASIAISADGKVVGVGGWDGDIRLFSAATLKPLGRLHYHRETVHVLQFAKLPLTEYERQVEAASTLDLAEEDVQSDDEDGSDLDGVPPRHRWLASGGKDKRISLWGLKAF